MGNLINTDELIKELGVSRQTIYNWRKQGMPCIKVNNTIRFDFKDVIAWLKKEGKDSQNGVR